MILGEQIVQLEVWEISIYRQFRSVGSSMLRNCSVAIVLFDAQGNRGPTQKMF
jgi:hypothetical protein